MTNSKNIHPHQKAADTANEIYFLNGLTYEDSGSGFKASGPDDANKASGLDDSNKDQKQSFVIEGTDKFSPTDIQAAVNYGRTQYYSPQARQLVKDAVAAARQGKDIELTGHSMGGGLAQVLGYDIQKELEGVEGAGKVSVIGFASLGGQTMADKMGKEIDPEILAKMNVTNYKFKGDILTGDSENMGKTVTLPDYLRTKYDGPVMEVRGKYPQKSNRYPKKSPHSMQTYVDALKKLDTPPAADNPIYDFQDNEPRDFLKDSNKSDPGKADLKGSSGKDSLSDGESAKPAYSPDIQNFLEDLKKSDDPVSDILLKDSRDWTQEEVNQVHASDAYQIASNPKRAEATGKVKAWYDEHYTTNPVQKDETGKTVEPAFITVPRKEPVPAKGKDGQPVLDGVLGAGAKIADMAGKNGLSTAIKGAQIGFNLLNKQRSGNKNAGPSGLLKTDGLFGPRTKQALRGSVAELGRPKVENAVALGTFQNLLEKKRGDLAQTAHDSFSGLFQKPAPFKAADKSPTPWGMVVQDTLNDVGGDAFKPLKSDGWIGPKTADAFRRTVKPSGMGGFLNKLGSNFGFF